MAKPVDLLFELWTRRMQNFKGGSSVPSWWIRLNRPFAVAMRPYVKLLWPLVEVVVVVFVFVILVHAQCI